MTKRKSVTAIMLSIASVALLGVSVWALYSGFVAFGGAMLGVAIWALYMGYIPFGGAMLGLAMVCGAAIALTCAKR